MEFIENLQHQTKIQMPVLLQQIERNNHRIYIHRNAKCEMEMKQNRMKYHIENGIVQTFNSIIRQTNKQTNKSMMMQKHSLTQSHCNGTIGMLFNFGFY